MSYEEKRKEILLNLVKDLINSPIIEDYEENIYMIYRLAFGFALDALGYRE